MIPRAGARRRSSDWGTVGRPHGEVRDGADGFLLKEDAGGELIRAVQTVRKGGKYISPLLSGLLDKGIPCHGSVNNEVHAAD